MKIMKILDEYAGRIMIIFILIFKKIFGRRRTNFNSKNILLIKFWGIGSIVLTTLAINKIKKNFPDSKIYFLTLDNNRGICKQIKEIDEVITIGIDSAGIFVAQFISALRRLRKINFDAIIDFEFYTYFSSIIVSLIKSNESAGFDNLKNYRKFIYTKPVLFNDKIHTKDNFLNLFANAFDTGIEPKGAISDFPGFKVQDKVFQYGKFKITVNTNASRLAYERRLPVRDFAEIINSLSKTFECEIILTGSADETSFVDKVYENLENRNCITNLCGRTNVPELISIINSSVCLITNDSGPLHIASALNIPSISFFGPESPARYGPLSEKNLCFYKNLKCSPCMSISNSKTVNCIYDSPRCMEEFNLNEVNFKIISFIESLILREKISQKNSLNFSEIKI